MKAIWNNKVIAESNSTVVVENNHYFPERKCKGRIFAAFANPYHLSVEGACLLLFAGCGRNEKTRTLPGSTRIQNLPQRILPTTLHFGKALK